MPNEPYVAVPSNISVEEMETVKSLFEEKGLAPVLYGRDLPAANFGGGTAIVEFTNWLVSIPPELLRSASLWAFGILMI